MAEILKKITTKTLLEKLQPETCWAITAETLTRFVVSRILKTSTPFLGKDDGILSLLSGWDKETEIKEKVYSEGGRKMYPFAKETFNIPVEDAVGAVKLASVTLKVSMGPEWEIDAVEKTPERVVLRYTKCPFWERYKEFEANPELIPCDVGHQAWCEEGLKAINPKINYKLMKSMPSGDPYCEDVYEFMEE